MKSLTLLLGTLAFVLAAGPSLVEPVFADAVPSSPPATITNAVAGTNSPIAQENTNPPAPAQTTVTNTVVVPGPSAASGTNVIPVAAAVATNAPTATSTNSAPQTTNSDANIRFNFADMPYMDAVRRFAQMAGKPLVADINVDGTLTFSDPRPYTYGEALDALNLVLSTKQAMLMEDGRYLRLVLFKELPQMPIRILHGTEPTDGIRPGQVVTVVMRLKNLDAGDITQPLSTMLSAAGSVAPLSRGRGLIVTDRMENIRRVQQMLDQIDNASPVQREMKTYTLHNASGMLLAELINRTFGIATAPKRTVFNEQRKTYKVLPPDPTDYVTAIFAEASNTLVLFGPGERITMAEQLINKFETEAGARASEVKIIYPQMPVDQLARLVREAIPGVAQEREGGRRAAVMAKVIPDQASNRLIVTAPAAGQLDAIIDLIHRLDPSTQETPPAKTGSQAAQPELRVIDVKSGSAQAMASLLREALSELSRNQTGSNALAHVRVQAAPGSNRLLLVGKPDALDEVTHLIGQLDIEEGQPETTRVFKLHNATAGQVAEMINRAMGSNQYRRRGGGFVGVAAEDRSNCLIVAASGKQMKLIEDVIKQIETIGGTDERQMKILELTNSPASQLANTMSRLFGPEMYSRQPSERVALTSTANDRALVLEADAKMMPRLEQAVKALDAQGKSSDNEMRVVDLKSGSAEALAPMLSQTLRELGRNGSQSEPLARVLVQASLMGNRLLLAGPAEALNRVTNLVAQLDTVQTNNTARVFKLKNADARQVADMIMRAMTSRDWRQRGAGTVVAAAEERSNCVIVSAPEAQMKLVEQVINQLEEAGKAGGQQLKVIPVARNSAASIAAMMVQLFFPQIRSGDPNERIAVTASPDDHALVVEAGEAMMPRLEQAVTALDVAPTKGAMEVRTYSLPQGSPGDLVQSLERIFTGQQPRYGQRRFGMPGLQEPPAPRFELDSASGTLMVAATADQFPQIEEVLTKLRAAAVASSEIRTFRLQYGDPNDVADLLQSVLIGEGRQPWRGFRGWRGGSGPAEIKVAAAAALNAVVVQAPPDKLAEASELIKTLDTPSTNRGSIQAVQLQNADADAVATAVLRTLQGKNPRGTPPSVTVTAVPGSRSLLVNGPPDEMAKVLKLIREVDQTSTSNQLQTRVFPLQNGEARELSRVLTQLLQGIARAQPRFASRYSGSQFTVAADERLNSLIVSATPEYFQVVEQLLPTLDQAPQHSDRQVQFYWLQNADASDVEAKLEALFQDRTQKERPVIDADEFANSLTVVAKPADLVDINDMVQKLDATARDTSLQVRMIPLAQIPVERMATMLTNIYSQMNKGAIRVVDALPKPTVATNTAPATAPRTVVTTNNASLTSTATNTPAGPPPPVTVAMDKAANALIVSGPAYELDHIESLVSQLSSSFTSPEFEIRQYPLKEADPVVVARVLNELFKPQPVPGQPPANQPQQQRRGRGERPGNGAAPQPGNPNARGQRGQPQPAVPEVAAVAESRTHSVILRARPSDLPLLESIIEQLDKSELSSQLAHRLVPLQHVTPNRILPLVQQMLAQLRSVRPGEPVVVASDPGWRALFLVGRDTVLNQIENLVHELDTPADFSEIELRVFPLKNAQAADLATLLRSVLQPENARDVTPEVRQLQQQISQLKLLDQDGKPIHLDLTKPVKIVADPPQPTSVGGANRLIIGSTPDNLNALGAVVKLLDTVPLAEGMTARLVRLEHVDATLVAQALNATFQSGQGGGRGGRSGRFGRGGGGANSLNVGVDARNNLLVLSGREETLALAEEMIKNLDTAAAVGAESIRIFPLEHADASSVLQVLTDLGRGPGAQRMRPAERPTLSVDERSNALIAFGSDQSLAFVAQLVKQLDQTLPTGLNGIRIIALQNADATAIAASLQRLLDERMRTRGGSRGGNSMRTAVIADPRSNSLLVSGSPESFDLIQSLIKQLDQPDTSLAGQMRLIPLQHADAQTLAATLTQLFARHYQALRMPGMQRNQPVILADPRSNSLLVAAGVDDNRALDALLEKLDREPENPSVELTVLGLQFNDATQMALTLRSIFTARLQSLTPPGQRPSPSDRVDVQPDSLSNALIISASKQNLDLVRQLLAKLDAEPTPTGGVLQTFTLQHADVQRVASMLQSLVQQGVYRPGLSAAGGRRNPSDALAIAADAPSNTLIVSASPANMLIVKQLINQLDTAQYNNASDIRLYQLKHARASYLARVLQQFFQAKRAGEAAPGSGQRSVPVTITPDDRTDTLLITGGKESFAAVDRIVEQLDSEKTMMKTNFRVFPLKNATATTLQATLQRLFANRPPPIQGEPREPVTVIADGWANALIVGATDDDLQLASSLIEELDSPQPSGGPQVQVFQLAKADATRVAQTLQSLFRSASGAPGGATGGSSPVMINVDQRLNAIVVSAGVADLKRIADLVKKLDTSELARVAEIRIFPLKNARATELSTILNNVLNTNAKSLTQASPARQSLLQFITRSDKGKDLVTSALKEGVIIVPDTSANALVVSAPLDYMDLLSQIIERLDDTAPTMANIKIFNLKNADARQMALVLTSLFRLQSNGSATANPQGMRYFLRTETTPNGQTPVEPAATTDQAGATVGSPAEDALTVTVDLRSNSLLVSGTEHYVELASDIIETLDSTPAQERKTMVYRLKNSQALPVETALRTFLQQDIQTMLSILGPSGVGTAQNILDREVSIVAETNNNCLLISASPRYFSDVENLVTNLDLPQPQVLIQVLLAEVTLDNNEGLGVEWNYQSKGTPQVSSGTDLGAKQLGQQLGFGGFSSAITGDNYDVLINALAEENRLEVLSRPQILTADNQMATINIGQRVPLVSNASVTPQGGTVNSFNYTNVGVMLTVTPRISPDGYVQMEVQPSVSDLSQSTLEVSPGFSAPIINERTATTTVTVKSGDSVLIGGLISTSDNTNVKKVPLLGDIPGLGLLFRSRAVTKQRKELLVILTPQILTKGEGTGTEVEARKYTEQELRQSGLKQKMHLDSMQEHLLDQIYPPPKPPAGQTTNAPAAGAPPTSKP